MYYIGGMNFLNKILFIGLICLMNAGCGSDGDDGDVYVRIRAVLEPTNVIIDNPDIPLDFQYDVYYKTKSGSYPFSYIDHNDIQHPLPGEFGVLEIVSTSGSKGGLFSSGENGEDLYVDLILLSTGAVIENYDYYTIVSTLDYAP